MKKTSAYLFAATLLLLNLDSSQAQPYTITTIAGQPWLGDLDGTNTTATFGLPLGIAEDAAGNFYVTDAHYNVIREISRSGTNWVVTTIAGTPGVSGSVDGTNSSALFNYPSGIAVDANTNIFVSDTGNNRIRKIILQGTNWVVTTYAGSRNIGTSIDGTGTNAVFYIPRGIAVDRGGNLYVADNGSYSVRLITPAGNVGSVSTIAGQMHMSGSRDGSPSLSTLRSPNGVAVDANTNVYVTDDVNNTVREITQVSYLNWVTSTPMGLPLMVGNADGTNSNARFNSPSFIAVDGKTNLYIVDGGNYDVRKAARVGTNWVVTTIAGAPGNPGNADGTNSNAQFKYSEGIVVDSGTNLYVTDTWEGTIRTITTAGTNRLVSTIAGDAGLLAADAIGTNAHFFGPSGAAVDQFGNIFVADTLNATIRELSQFGTNWVSRTLAGDAGVFGSVDGTNNNALFYFDNPQMLAVDGADNLYIGDPRGSKIRKIAAVGTDWVVTTLAGGSFGQANGTNAAAQFGIPMGLAVDASSNIYVTDYEFFTIRKVAPNGTNWVVTTLAGNGFGHADGTNTQAQFTYPDGIAVDYAGNLFVADEGNCTIRKVTPVGTNWVVTTIAGLAGAAGSVDGVNSNARFNFPRSVAVDSAGTVFVADNDNRTLRRITPTGTNWVVDTIAGAAGIFGTRDGTGGGAQFTSPSGIAVDGADNLYVADYISDTIRFGQAAAWLQASLSSNQLVISWPLAASNYVLQTSAAMSSNAAWTAVTNGVTLSGLQFVVTNNADAPAAFFRLQQQ